jgi:hypothetical protein
VPDGVDAMNVQTHKATDRNPRNHSLRLLDATFAGALVVLALTTIFPLAAPYCNAVYVVLLGYELFAAGYLAIRLLKESSHGRHTEPPNLAHHEH